MGITCLESFTASSMGLAVGSIAPTGVYALAPSCPSSLTFSTLRLPLTV